MDSKGFWFAQQSWNNVLFLHWPVPPEILHPLINKPFELDVFNGQAWVSVVLLQAKGSRLRGMPRFASYPPFLQLNLRTYVVLNGKPGVYFLSIDSNHSLVVNGARLFSIPYIKAQMQLTKTNEQLSFLSHRTQKGYPETSLSAVYRPHSPLFIPAENTLNHWLIERYSLWTIKKNKIYEGLLSHEPWHVQNVEVDLSFNHLFPFEQEPSLYQKPLAYYTESMQTYLHPFELKGLLGESIT